jgi:hypothetical protein
MSCTKPHSACRYSSGSSRWGRWLLYSNRTSSAPGTRCRTAAGSPPSARRPPRSWTSRGLHPLGGGQRQRHQGGGVALPAPTSRPQRDRAAHSARTYRTRRSGPAYAERGCDLQPSPRTMVAWRRRRSRPAPVSLHSAARRARRSGERYAWAAAAARLGSSLVCEQSAGGAIPTVDQSALWEGAIPATRTTSLGTILAAGDLLTSSLRIH